MKKIVIIIGIIVSVLMCTALADDSAVKFILTPTTSSEEVSVLIEYEDIANMCGGSFNFFYDKTKLEVVSIEEGETIKNTTHFINQNYNDSGIRTNWVTTTVMPDKGSLMTIKLKLFEGNFSKEDIYLDSLKIADGNGDKLTVAYEIQYKESNSPSHSNGNSGGKNHSSGRKPTDVESVAKKEESHILEIKDDANLMFYDVASSDWFYESVKYVYTNNLMKGISDMEFAPLNNVTRAMFVTVLHRMEGEPETENASFSDVQDGSWYEKAVSWASEHKIVSGTSETTFSPDVNITREQMAAILQRYAFYKNYEQNNVENQVYSDSDEISEYALEGVKWVSNVGIMTGVGNNNFSPKSNATRAEAAAVFTRTRELLSKQK